MHTELRTLLIDAIVEKYCKFWIERCMVLDGCGVILPAANICAFIVHAQWHVEKSQKHMKVFVFYKIYLLEMV